MSATQFQVCAEMGAGALRQASRLDGESNLGKAIEFSELGLSYAKAAVELITDQAFLAERLKDKMLLRVERIANEAYLISTYEDGKWVPKISGDADAVLELARANGYTTQWLLNLFNCPISPRPNIRVYTTLPKA